MLSPLLSSSSSPSRLTLVSILLAATASQPQWFYLGEVVPNPIPLKTAKALRQQQTDDSSSATAGIGADSTTERKYEGKRIMGGKKRASLAAAQAVERGEGEIEVSPGKRQTRGKQVNYSADTVGGDEDDDDDGEGDFNGMEVDE